MQILVVSIAFGLVVSGLKYGFDKLRVLERNIQFLFDRDTSVVPAADHREGHS